MPTEATPNCVTNWRAVLARWDPAAARLPVSAHAAQLLTAKQERPAAKAAYEELLTVRPSDFAAWNSLAFLHRQLGETAEAERCHRRAHAIELARLEIPPDEQAAADFFSAADGYTEAPATVPARYVEALFDRYAESFETHLVDQLRYQAPSVLVKLVEGESGASPAGELHVLDLGCGTGLVGVRFRSLASRLEGVDLSSAMIEEATRKGVYDRLEVDELVRFLNREAAPERYDLILAADVFNYVGDLSPALAGCAARSKPSGRLAFTVEAWDGPWDEEASGYHLRRNRRYAHERRGLEKDLGDAGWSPVRIDEVVLRYEQESPVVCYAVLCRLAV